MYTDRHLLTQRTTDGPEKPSKIKRLKKPRRSSIPRGVIIPVTQLPYIFSPSCQQDSVNINQYLIMMNLSSIIFRIALSNFL